MARKEETGSSYLNANEVFPQEVVDELFSHLGTAQKITFAPSHRPYNYSEGRLPAKLVDKCRELLDQRDITKRRIVFVSASKAEKWDPSFGQALLERGWPPGVVAAVIGYHHITLRRWGVASVYREVRHLKKPEVAKTEETLALGFTRFQQLYPGKEASPSTYQKIGSALLDAASPEVVARAAEISAQGGGRARVSQAEPAAKPKKRNRYS